MPRRTTRKQKPQKRKSPGFEGIRSMEKTMEATTKMVGTVVIAGMTLGLAGAVISKI